MFPLVYVWVRQWEAGKLHPYNSIAQIHILPFIKIVPIWPSLEYVKSNFAVLMAMLVVINNNNF